MPIYNRFVLKFTFSLLTLMLIHFSVTAQTFTPKFNVSMCDHSNGFYEYLPKNYENKNQNWPLLIFCHGVGELGDGSESQLPRVLVNGTPRQINQGIFPTSFSVNSEKFSFVILCPQFTVTPGSKDVDQIINYAIKNYNIDTTRIYLTGLSMGGGTVWYYIGENTEYAKRIAAAVPVCGACYPADYRCMNIAEGNVPVWATHNDGDPTVPSSYTKEFVQKINGEPEPPTPRAKKTIFPSDSHNAWTATYDLNFKEGGVNVYEWMLQFQRKVVLAVSDFKFEATSSGNKVNLNWSTESEKNNKGFIIERSFDGVKFDSIAFIAGKNGQKNLYIYTDDFPGSSNYYRLKQVDENGQYSLSAVKFVKVNSTGNNIFIYPNPIEQDLQFRSETNLNNFRLTITDMSGKTILTRKLTSGFNHHIPLNIPAGMYMMLITDNKEIYKKTFLKK